MYIDLELACIAHNLRDWIPLISDGNMILFEPGTLWYLDAGMRDKDKSGYKADMDFAALKLQTGDKSRRSFI